MGDGIVQVRFASEDDLAFVGQDGYLANDVLQRKIAAREVFIAEQERQLATFGSNFSGPKCPTLDLFAFLMVAGNEAWAGPC
jgi:hypothetical protein